MLPMKEAFLPALVAVSCLGLGCTAPGVSLRPDGSPGPQPCPEKALEAMRILRLRPGDGSTVEVDANQSGFGPITVTDGPVESILKEELGYLPAGTRMYGRIWTTGQNVAIRYYEARPPDGDPIPLCAVARLSRGGLRKRPDSPPGTAVLEFSRSGVYIVDAFR
jgi:hypothetical protein